MVGLQRDGARPAGKAGWFMAFLGVVAAVGLAGLAVWGATGGAARDEVPGRAAEPMHPTGPTAPTSPPASRTSPTAPASSSTTAASAAQRSPLEFLQPATGDCITIDDAGGSAGAGMARTVACSEPHLVEVAGLVDVGERFSSEPTTDEWTGLLEVACTDLMRQYVGPRYDDRGTIVLRTNAPSSAEWAGGDRLAECLLSVAADGTGAVALSTGSVRTADQTPATEVGDCVAVGAHLQIVPAVVDCAVPHQLQVTAPVDLTARFEHYPTAEEWQALDAECVVPFEQLFGSRSPVPGEGQLVPQMLRIPVRSWLVGRRSTACAVGELDAAGEELVLRTGPLTG